MSEAIAFFSGLIAMAIVWFVHDTKYNPYMRGYSDGLNDGIQQEERTETYVCDSISRQAAIETLAMANARKGWRMLRFSEIHKILLELPPVRPNRGKWVRTTSIYRIDGLKMCQCSRCAFTAVAVEGFGCYDYCPNCGAYMRGEEDER